MKNRFYLSFILVLVAQLVFSQSVDDSFSQEKMRKDFEVFKKTRLAANSGLYRYRTEKQIDSIYNWAEGEIEKSYTYLDFYNIICHITDFEGSLHNDTSLPSKYMANLRKESKGYFPFPIKWIDGMWVINYENDQIPVGSEIIAINDIPMSEVILNLHKYYTTDGVNTTGKRIGIRAHFPRYYRLHFGKQDSFKVVFKRQNSDTEEKRTLNSVASSQYYTHYDNRYSKPFDQIYHADLEGNQKYDYTEIDASTGLLTLYTFDMGNEKSSEHQVYLSFLDSVFTAIKTEHKKNLIVDIRYNGGGDDPNDLVAYSYLTQRNFQENKEAWISFEKIPHLKYVYTKVPRFLRPLGVRRYNKMFTEGFYIEKENGLYQGPLSKDHKIRSPRENAFTGNIYLLISPRVASAGTLFAAMVAGNDNTVVIGEETMGGYYGHNGHAQLGYILPKSKLETFFYVVNLEQDVPQKANQIYNRGIIPDIDVSQSFEDFLNHDDTQLRYTLKLIEKNRVEE